MRLLTICNACQRQYDASKLKPGSRFRCHCGEVVKVDAPTGHDASVVRCSSCGAPREAESKTCPHCSSDFTLHERDLQTVCPHCAARISDRAKFCHHCGHAITSTSVAGKKVDLNCPACDQQTQLVSRALGSFKVAAAECDRCAGLWLGMECFQRLIAKANDGSLANCDFAQMKAKPATRAESASTESATARGNWRYRKCPECDKMMQRRHYAKRSGVIIDSCRDHGIWFDAEELQQVIQHVRTQGLAGDGLPTTRQVKLATRRQVKVIDKDGERTVYDSGTEPVTGGNLTDLAEILGNGAADSLLDRVIGSLFDL